MNWPHEVKGCLWNLLSVRDIHIYSFRGCFYSDTWWIPQQTALIPTPQQSMSTRYSEKLRDNSERGVEFLYERARNNKRITVFTVATTHFTILESLFYTLHSEITASVDKLRIIYLCLKCVQWRHLFSLKLQQNSSMNLQANLHMFTYSFKKNTSLKLIQYIIQKWKRQTFATFLQ